MSRQSTLKKDRKESRYIPVSGSAPSPPRPSLSRHTPPSTTRNALRSDGAAPLARLSPGPGVTGDGLPLRIGRPSGSRPATKRRRLTSPVRDEFFFQLPVPDVPMPSRPFVDSMGAEDQFDDDDYMEEKSVNALLVAGPIALQSDEEAGPPDSPHSDSTGDGSSTQVPVSETTGVIDLDSPLPLLEVIEVKEIGTRVPAARWLLAPSPEPVPSTFLFFCFTIQSKSGHRRGENECGCPRTTEHARSWSAG